MPHRKSSISGLIHVLSSFRSVGGGKTTSIPLWFGYKILQRILV